MTAEFNDDVMVRRTADVAVGLWALAVGLMMSYRRRQARAVWGLGSLAFLVHVLVAFDRAHGWSHANAVKHVDDVSGFGPGIFVSYLFTLVWLVDAIWWSLAPDHYDRRPWQLDRGIHLFMAFIVLNGTVIYESGWIRWAAVGAFALLGCLWIARFRQGRRSAASPI